MNKRNILIVAMLAMILMGSVVLSAGNTTFIIHNVYSITQHDPVEIFFFDSSSTGELYNLDSSTLTINHHYITPPTPSMSVILVKQGNREWRYSGWGTPAIGDVELELPGPYENRNPESDY
jgi:hypothetical protein